MQELKDLLLSYLQKVGVTTDFDLRMKNYSNSLFGRYNPNNNSVTLYVFDSPKCTQSYTVWELLKTLIHEACHCEQWKDPYFVRHKGVMHNTDFWEKYNSYVSKATECIPDVKKEVRFINEKITLR